MSPTLTLTLTLICLMCLRALATLFPGARNRAALEWLLRQVARTPRLDARSWRNLLRAYDGPLLPQAWPSPMAPTRTLTQTLTRTLTLTLALVCLMCLRTLATLFPG